MKNSSWHHNIGMCFTGPDYATFKGMLKKVLQSVDAHRGGSEEAMAVDSKMTQLQQEFFSFKDWSSGPYGL